MGSIIVVVKRTLPKTKLTGDAVVTTIEGSVLEHLGTSLDVLSKVPGMISKNGSLEVIGRGEPLYYINGRKVTDNSELRNLMSEDIKSIDVVSNPGAEYGGEVRCVVRIRTIKRQGEGVSFALTSQAKQHIYKNHDTEPSWSVVDLNYRKGGVDVIGKIVYFNQRNYQISDIDGGTIVRTAEGRIKENMQKGYLDYRGHTGGWSYEGGLNWQINDKHSVGVKLDYGYNNFGNSMMILEDDIITDGQKTDHVYSINDSKTPSSNSLNGNIYYDGNINELNVNFNADFSKAENNTENIVTETSLTSQNDIKTGTESSRSMGAWKLVLSYPIWNGKLKLGAEETYVGAEQEYSITLNEIPSSEAELTENTLSGFGEYSVALPVGQLVAGLRYEHVDFDYTNKRDSEKDVRRVQNNWFPSFNFATKVKNVGLSLGYSSRIQRPRYDQMSTEILYDNKFAYQTGDPTLLNEIQRTLSMNANWQWLTLVTSYETVDNTIQQEAYPYNEDGIVMIQYANAKDKVKKLNIYLNASPSFGIWNPRYTVGLQKQYYKTTVVDPRCESGERRVTHNKPTYFVQANNAFRLKRAWIIDIDYQYTSTLAQLLTEVTKPSHDLSLGVSKTFLEHDALNVRLSWNDILNKTVTYFTTDYGNCLNTQNYDRYAPCLLLRASYRFNTANSKYKGTGAGQDAKNRM